MLQMAHLNTEYFKGICSATCTGLEILQGGSLRAVVARQFLKIV